MAEAFESYPARTRTRWPTITEARMAVADELVGARLALLTRMTDDSSL